MVLVTISFIHECSVKNVTSMFNISTTKNIYIWAMNSKGNFIMIYTLYMHPTQGMVNFYRKGIV